MSFHFGVKLNIFANSCKRPLNVLTK